MRLSKAKREVRGPGRYGRTVKPGERYRTLRALKKHTNRRFSVRTDRTVVDRPEEEKRFQLVYNLLSRKYAVRRLVRVEVGERESTSRPTVTGRYAAADWLEREMWDQFGVGVVGHPDRRRLLSDYGKEGYSMRKDYPLSGYSEVRYDEGRKRVVEEPVSVAQLMGE